MIKTRAWPVRAMYMLVAFALVISLMISAAPSQTVDAAAHEVKAQWEKVPTPSEQGWVLAPDSVIVDYAVASEGEVTYAIVGSGFYLPMPRPQPNGNSTFEAQANGEDMYLLKSTDHAATWKDITSGLKSEIKKIGDFAFIEFVATDGVDPDFVAVAANVYDASYHVFFSTNGGSTFRDIGKVPDLSGAIVLRVSPEVNGVREVAIGGVNDSAQGVIWRSTVTGTSAGGWVDTTAPPYEGWEPCAAVVDIQFAPSWAEDKTVLVATATNTTVYLQSGTWGIVRGWNEKADFEPAVVVKSGVGIHPMLGKWTAGIALPTDYEGLNPTKRYAWVWVNYFDGDGESVGEILRVRNKAVTSVGWQIEGMPLLANISYWGTIASGKAIASVLGTGHMLYEQAHGPEDYFNMLTAPCAGVEVYRNDDILLMDICCIPWMEPCKPPTGSFAMEAFYVTAEKAYAVALWGFTHYDEGAWSFSFDDGDTWNQLSLIDTHIDYLSDVAVSPDCNKTMLVSVNLLPYHEWKPGYQEGMTGCDSVWLHAVNLPEAPEYSGKWIRTWSGMLHGDNGCEFPERGLLRLNPEETTGDTVYLVDRMNNTVYWNDLEGLACWTRRSTTAVVENIVDLAVKNASTIYILGESGHVSMSPAYGAAPTWIAAVDSGVDKGWTIAVHGDDILVGGQEGDVAHSADGGETFTSLAGLPIEGYVTLAFDSYFDQNDTIYAAAAHFTDECYMGNPTGGIFLWVMGESTSWTSLGAAPYAYTGLVLDTADGNTRTSPATGGVLYASYIGKRDENILGYPRSYWTGVARSLTPIVEILCAECVDWDYLVVGLDEWEGFIMMPKALKICGCLTPDSYSKLFAIDGWTEYYDMEKGSYGTVWTWEDCYSKSGPTLVDPADGQLIPADACDCANSPFAIKWTRLCDSCFYDVQFAADAAFEDVMWSDTRVSPSSAANPSALIGNKLLPGETYYWRVRASEAATGQVVHSWWSETRTVSVAPMAGTGVHLIAPEMGATHVARTGIAFVWDSISPADSYSWVLSPNADLSGAVDSTNGLQATAYTYTGTLTANTPYYWRVTAYRDGAPTSHAMGTFRTASTEVYCSPQSGLCFNTEAELREHHEQLHKDAMRTPAWVWVIIAIGAVLVIVVIVLIFRTRRV